MFEYSICNNGAYDSFEDCELFTEVKIPADEFKKLVEQALLNIKERTSHRHISPVDIAREVQKLDNRFKFQYEIIEHVENATIDYAHKDKIQDIMRNYEDLCEVKTYPTQDDDMVHFLII